MSVCSLVFVQQIAVRFSIDTGTRELIWEDTRCSTGPKVLNGKAAAAILASLLATNPRYCQLIDKFRIQASLDSQYWFLESLKKEADQNLALERREADKRHAEIVNAPLVDERHKRTNSSMNVPVGKKASWETLIIPKNLRENLQAYCRILQDFQAYQDAGVHLPKGLLFYGPPGNGKTQIAKTLSAEAGLNFIALSTSDCKVGFIGHAAAKIKEVFNEARSKQPTLIFIDELDAVCPPRGDYHDCISQEVYCATASGNRRLAERYTGNLPCRRHQPSGPDRFCDSFQVCRANRNPLPDATTSKAKEGQVKSRRFCLSKGPSSGTENHIKRRMSAFPRAGLSRDSREQGF